MSVGKVREFAVKTGNWSSYVERLESYFLVNKVAAEFKLPTLISVMGEDAYELLATLASPTKPSALTYQRAVELLAVHLQPKPSELAERYKFRQRRQLSNESIAEYVTELKKLSRFCEFGSALDENLRDQLVCGLKSEIIRQRLFAEDKLQYTRAVSLALSLEAAERDANAVERGAVELAEGMHKLNYGECTRCGDSRHQGSDCAYKDYVCSLCQEIGHLRRMCPRRSRNIEYNHSRRRRQTAGTAGSFETRSSRGGRMIGRGASASGGGGGGGRGSWSRGAGRGARGAARGGPERAHASLYSLEQQGEMFCDDGNNMTHTDDDSEEEQPMYQMALSKYKPVCMEIMVENRLLAMEVDTGSALSCIGRNVYDELFNNLQLNSCNLTLKFYDGSTVQPLGYIQVVVSYKNRTKTLDLYVMNRGTTNLLGRQWLAELNIPVKMHKVNLLNNNVISDDQLNNQKIISNIISRHESLFDGTLGKYTGGCAALSVREGAVPIYCRARPLPYALRERVDAELDGMLRAGVVEPVTHSDWATPLVVVNKADGGLRICADYKVTLNKVLEIDRYPVPKMEDLFSHLSGNKLFTKLDLSQAYNQIELSEDSKKFTVINTHRGLFKYSRLVYGLSSSPGIFQKIMVNLFSNVPSVVVFYDDILIKNKDLESHLQSIKEVLEILEKNGLKIKKSKCEFLAKEVRYLGFIIDENGVRVDPEKVKAITTMPHPRNVTELKSFLGMVNFYGKFIDNLSAYLSPLYKLLKKDCYWEWGMEQNKAFETVKGLLISTKTLVHFDIGMESVLTVDASSRGLGAVLAQRAPEPAGGSGGGGSYGDERVVAYASRSLTTHEAHYSQIHKEALAIVFAIDKFHQYLYGRKFVLRTDHKPLVSIFGPNIGIPSAAASRLQRWAVKLSAYDFAIEYVKTDKNTADVLSRLIKSQKDEVASEKEDIPEQTYLHFATDALLLDYNVLRRETRSDPILSRVLSYISDGWPSEVEIKELKPYFNRKTELYSELGCVMWGHRVVIPATCRNKVITELHDPHMGIVKTKSLARSYVWWAGIDEAVEAECRACAVCAAVADAPPGHVLHSWPWPSRPWSRLHLDFLGPINGVTYLVVVDSCSKWIEAIRMKRTTASAVIAALRDLWAKFGLPKQIVSDNGPPFSSSEFQIFLTHNGIEHIFTAPYHPASNGAAESAVKICKRAIKKAYKQNVDVHTALCRFLLAYRNTEHATTGDSPAKILQGRNLRMRLDVLKPERETRVAARQARSEEIAGGTQRQLEPGAQVWYREYRGTDKWLAGTVIKKNGNTNYTIKSIYGTEIHRHVNQLKHRVTRELENDITNGEVALVVSRPNIVDSRQNRKSLTFPMSRGKEQEPGTDSLGESRVESSPRREVEPAAAEAGPVYEPSVSANREPCSDSKRTRKPPVRFGFDEHF